MNETVLHGRPGWGSAIVELQLTWYGLPFRFEDVGDLFESEAARERLRPLNAIVQVPTLTWRGEDGQAQVMTESAAITLHLADLTGRDELVPGAKAPERAAFLRWLVFLVANIYPTFTYADLPGRFVTAGGEVAQKAFRAEVDAYARRLWAVVEAAAGSPWLLGRRMSALDFYAAVMTRWRPRREWFAQQAPRVLAAADAAAALPTCAPVMARNFPA